VRLTSWSQKPNCFLLAILLINKRSCCEWISFSRLSPRWKQSAETWCCAHLFTKWSFVSSGIRSNLWQKIWLNRYLPKCQKPKETEWRNFWRSMSLCVEWKKTVIWKYVFVDNRLPSFQDYKYSIRSREINNILFSEIYPNDLYFHASSTGNKCTCIQKIFSGCKALKTKNSLCKLHLTYTSYKFCYYYCTTFFIMNEFVFTVSII